MESALVVVVLVSLIVALAMTLVTWRIVREERRRSAARVAALVAERSRRVATDEIPLASDWRRQSAPDHDARVPGPSAATPVRPAQSGAPVSRGVEVSPDLFAGARSQSDGLGPVVAVVVAALLVVAAGVALFTPDRSDRPSPPPAVRAAVVPLELVSLSHSRSGDTMAISGAVRNPESGRELRRLSAVVMLFDRDGALLNRGATPLDYLTLAPGEESPFVIPIDATRAVARYRISFRHEDDSVMPHVDRRSVPPRQQGLVAGRAAKGT